MSEGEILKKAVRVQFDNMDEASSFLKISKTTLHKYFNKEKLPTDFVDFVNDKMGLSIRKDQKRYAIQAVLAHENKDDEIAILKKQIEAMEAKIDLLIKLYKK